MKLYHFTSQLHLGGCRQVGIRLGTIPTFIDPHRVGLQPHNYQWLTSHADFTQSWEAESSLPYHRNDFRITTVIPKSHRDHLVKWVEHCAQFTDQPMYEVMNSFGDPEHWYVFIGTIKPAWFRGIAQNPDMVVADEQSRVTFVKRLRKQFPAAFAGTAFITQVALGTLSPDSYQ